ncbi:MAG TPA: PAS-domain containing protein [Rhizomicrobium sp.]|nr:PAS-domain containing protein [Rhizomicrobium sp.]
MNTNFGVKTQDAIAPSLYDTWAGYVVNRAQIPDVTSARVILFSATAFSTLCCLWACAERIASLELRAALKAQIAQMMRELLYRDAMIGAGCDAVVLDELNTNFGRGRDLLEAAVNGTDGKRVQSALLSLAANGKPFEMVACSVDAQSVHLTGRTIGGTAVIFPRIVTNADAAARDAAEAAVHELASLQQIVDRIPMAVAIFGEDRRLQLSNPAFAKRLKRSPDLSREHPLLETVLDSLRAARQLPEQPQYQTFKASLLRLFDTEEERQETWTLPDRKSERLSALPNALGGITLVFEDITGEIELAAALSNQTLVQRAILDALDDAVAIFAADGHLVAHNTAFARLWRLEQRELEAAPHVNTLDQISAFRIGTDEFWSAILAAVSALDMRERDRTVTGPRADGRVLTLSLTRLPDGSTMAVFTDDTDEVRFRAMLDEDMALLAKSSPPRKKRH